MDLRASVKQGVGAVRTLAGAGLLTPVPPRRALRMGEAFRRYGVSPAAGVAAAAARAPRRRAVVDERRAVSWGELHQRTNALAHAWRRRGVTSRDRVGLLCRDHAGFVEALVGSAKLGCDVVLLNTGSARPQLADVVSREGVTVLVHDDDLAPVADGLLPQDRTFVAWHEGRVRHDSLEALVREGGAVDPAPPGRTGRVVLLTSGTTGTPKGAARGSSTSATTALAFLDAIPLRARETTVIAAPLFHAWGLAHLQVASALTSTVVLRRRFDAEATLAAVARHRATALVAVPVMLQRIMELPPDVRDRYDRSSLRVVAVSGSAISGALVTRFMDAFGDVLYNLYGSTEVSWASVASPRDLRLAPETAGRPPLGTTVRILDPDGRPVPVGERGRIFVGNDFLFEGYTGGGGREVVDGLMATGDVGHFDERGLLYVEGREDDMIVSGGENVYPREVEELLLTHAEVADAAVVAVPDEEYGQRLAAYVVPVPGTSPTADDLRSFVRSHLARQKVPRDVTLVDDVPRNLTGKVLRRRLGGD